MKQLILSVLIALPFLFACEKTNTFSEEDILEIEQMMKEYRDAWKIGDSANILNKLSADVILFQSGKNSQPIFGKESVSEFWFPSTDVTYPITEYIISNSEINGSGDLSYYQGLSTLSWYTLNEAVASDSSTAISEFLTILKREDSEWKIFRQMYVIKDTGYSRSE